MSDSLLQQVPPGTALIHIGAHHGQEAATYANHHCPVLWIEACPLFIPRLQQHLAAYPQQQCRLGAVAAQAGQRRVFHISSNLEGVSSSFYPFGEDAERLWPELDLHHIQSTSVTTTTLDNLIEQECDWISQNNPMALVIDTQGAEIEVIQGGQGSLWRFDWIQVETSSANVYVNGNTRDAVHQLLSDAGFGITAEIEQRPGHGDRLYRRHQAIPASDRCFQSPNYQSINAARLQHISQLPLNLEQQSVLELGSGPGDITPFFLNRHCCVTSIDARAENIQEAHRKHSASKQWTGFVYDLSKSVAPSKSGYEIVIAYGILYHLEDPLALIQAIAGLKPKQFVLETCVTPEAAQSSDNEQQWDPLHRCSESTSNGSQSVSGIGCRPDRRWLWKTLHSMFNYVYFCSFQPNHPEFPLNWHREAIDKTQGLMRMIFIASSTPITSDKLTESLPMIQLPSG